jgi:hypothetical protein
MDFLAEYWFWIVLGGFGLIAVITLLMNWQKKKLRVFLPLFDNQEGNTSVFFRSTISGRVNGQPASIVFIPRDRYSPPRRVVTMASTQPNAWKISPRGPMNVEISFTPKVKTNDPAWDRQFVVRSKSSEAVLYLLGDLKKKEAVELLMQQPQVKYLESKGGKLKLFQWHKSVNDSTVPELQNVLELMGRFSY